MRVMVWRQQTKEGGSAKPFGLWLRVSVGAICFIFGITIAAWLVNTRAVPEVAVEQPAPTIEVASVEENIGLNSAGVSDYFLESQLKRQRQRSAQKELLEEFAANQANAPALRAQALEELLQLSRRIYGEEELERLLAARGYAKTLVVWYNERVAIIVEQEGLGSEDVAEIGTLAAQITGVPLDQITVCER